jgi:NAD(P)-dependent dehydrogenase (short-subunit alcohol dehydrogenase family)
MPRTTIDITVPDLTGRLALVTGASDGMGLGMAQRLAAAGAEVVLPVRNPRKGADAIARIRRDNPKAQVSLRDLDLSALDSVAALGDTLRAEGRPIAGEPPEGIPAVSISALLRRDSVLGSANMHDGTHITT